ncbi:hypothetical protein WJX77_006331 [Trebouxia sp. C0004]
MIVAVLAAFKLLNLKATQKTSYAMYLEQYERLDAQLRDRAKDNVPTERQRAGFVSYVELQMVTPNEILLPVDRNAAGVLVLREFKTQDRNHPVLYTRSLGHELTKELRASLEQNPRPYLFTESNPVQAARTTLADVMRYWLFLARQMSGLASGGLPPAFKAHCFIAYNRRHDEMVSAPCKLALFLHPLYRDAVSCRKENWVEVQQTAGKLWQEGYKKGKSQTQQLMTDLRSYKIHEDPFDLMPPDGELATLKLHWKTIVGTDDSLQLPQLALLMLDVKPHATDPEKTFSLMGWYHSSRRSQLLSKTTTAMTSIKMHYMELKG